MCQHVDEILNNMPAPKKSRPRLLIHTMFLSLSPLRLLTCSGHSSLSRSLSVTALATTPCRGSALAVCCPGGCSNDHPAPCVARATATMMRRRCSGQRSRGSPPTLLVAEVFLQASCPGCSCSHRFHEHIALGYFPVSELTTMPTTGARAR
jgi:hypothetical protein